MNAESVLDEYRMQNGIKHLMQQAWPISRKEVRAARRVHADQGLRVVSCMFCGDCSPELDGPGGRDWWKNHDCERRAA